MITIPHVETNITLACQNACIGCNHFIPMQKGERLSAEQVGRDLRDFGKVAHISRWAAIGGEPTLHPDIDAVLKAVRESGTVDIIEVWTNGARLKAMTETFWQLADEIDLTLYPGKPVDLDFVQAKCAEHGKVLRVKNGRDDFTTLLYKRTASDAEAAGIYKGCWYRTYCRVLDNGYFYRCCTSPFIPELILGLAKEADGIKVKGLTEQALSNYLNQPDTPASCYRCAGHSGSHIGWRAERDRDKWLAESMR